MPLPIRDLSTLHLSLNPAIADVHKLFPMSKYSPPVAMFRMFKLACEGVPLMGFLDEPTWMTMACLDDYAADHCIGVAVYAMSTGSNRSAVNAAFMHASAPFLTLMFNPLWSSYPTTSFVKHPGQLAPSNAPTNRAPVNGPVNAVANGPVNAPANAPANGPVNGPVNAPANAPPVNGPVNAVAPPVNGKDPTTIPRPCVRLRLPKGYTSRPTSWMDASHVSETETDSSEVYVSEMEASEGDTVVSNPTQARETAAKARVMP